MSQQVQVCQNHLETILDKVDLCKTFMEKKNLDLGTWREYHGTMIFYV